MDGLEKNPLVWQTGYYEYGWFAKITARVAGEELKETTPKIRAGRMSGPARSWGQRRRKDLYSGECTGSSWLVDCALVKAARLLGVRV